MDNTSLMELFPVDDTGLLFVAPDIIDWLPLAQQKVRLVIDLDAEIDGGVPTIPNSLMYVYFPVEDGEFLPDLVKLHALGRLAAEMMRHGRAVVVHCAMGFNRSALVAGVALTHQGLSGAEALRQVQERRSGALYNKVYAEYLLSLPPYPELSTDHANA